MPYFPKSLISLFVCLPHFGFGQKFTIPVFSGAQGEVGGNHVMFTSRIKWITNLRDSLNIPMVVHVGDLVNFDHYEVASKGYETFDINHIPYAITLGNHDT